MCENMCGPSMCECHFLANISNGSEDFTPSTPCSSACYAHTAPSYALQFVVPLNRFAKKNYTILAIYNCFLLLMQICSHFMPL